MDVDIYSPNSIVENLIWFTKNCSSVHVGAEVIKSSYKTYPKGPKRPQSLSMQYCLITFLPPPPFAIPKILTPAQNICVPCLTMAK